MNNQIRQAQSCAPDAREAVREFHAAIAQPAMSLVVFFCASSYDLDALAEEMRRLFGDTPVVGCTTAGEFGPEGHHRHSLTGFSLSSERFTVVSCCLEGLQTFDLANGKCFARNLKQRLAERSGAESGNRFALLLIDGLSVREEPVTWSLQSGLHDIPLVGGSAGDGLSFEKTYVYHDGRFDTDCAVLTLVSTPLPVKPFMSQHFVASKRRLVVTEADPSQRVVHEIDGLPAAQAYAEVLGVQPDNLDPMRFAASPVVVTIGGVHYVRSIAKAMPDGSLKFFCAIDEGMVLRVSHSENLGDVLERLFTAVRAEGGAPQLVVGCDCILRRLEIEQRDLAERVDALLRQNRVVGFNSYGEQYRGVHVNQTFTGVAIGSEPEADE